MTMKGPEHGPDVSPLLAPTNHMKRARKAGSVAKDTPLALGRRAMTQVAKPNGSARATYDGQARKENLRLSLIIPEWSDREKERKKPTPALQSRAERGSQARGMGRVAKPGPQHFRAGKGMATSPLGSPMLG